MSRYNMSSLDGCLIPAVAALILICFCLSFLGCASSRPCLPDIEFQDVEKEVRCFVDVDFPPPPEYEDYPPFDSENAKEWSLEVDRITNSNRAKSWAWIKAVLHLLEEHNGLEPECKQ